MGTKTNPGAWDCYANAEPDEPFFVLLARDQVAPDAVETWADLREHALREFYGAMTGPEFFAELDQIAEARKCALEMRAWRDVNREVAE